MQAQVLGRCGNQTGEGRDEPAGFVQIAVRAVLGVLGAQTDLLRGRTHQHDGRAGDHLDGGNLGELPYLRVCAGRSFLIIGHAC